MGARTKARKRALDVLFEAEQRQRDPLTLLADRIAEPGTEAALPQYSVDIVEGVLADVDVEDVLEDDRPLVELLGDEVGRTPVDPHPALVRLLVRGRPGEVRQQRRVDVDDPVPVRPDDPLGLRSQLIAGTFLAVLRISLNVWLERRPDVGYWDLAGESLAEAGRGFS